MSLEEFGYDDVSDAPTDAVESFERPDWQQKGEHCFFGEGTMNKPATKEVDEKQAIDINIIQDDAIVEQAAEVWTPEEKDKMVEAIQIVFNDGSTWHWPLRSWDNDPADMRGHYVERYAPEVIRWKAKQNGKDPDKAVRESRFYVETSEPEWVDRVKDTGLSEDARKWFNENAEYLPDLLKKVSSSGDDVELDTDNTDWTEDW
jgi:hypothetical protein